MRLPVTLLLPLRPDGGRRGSNSWACPRTVRWTGWPSARARRERPPPRTPSPGVRTSGAGLEWAWVSRSWFPTELWRGALRVRPPLPAACLPSGWGGVPSLVVQYPVLVVYSKFPRVPGLALRRVLSALSTLAAITQRAKIECLNCGECY